MAVRLPSAITARQLLLVTLLAAALFTRFYRLGTPNECYFDEVYFPTTGTEILKGDATAWDFYGHENTHPPLSKLFMAGGMGIFGHRDLGGADNVCWGDADDAPKKTDPGWAYDAFGWRFFGALAGVGSIVFIYLIARRLFDSEIAGMAAAFLMIFEGLTFAQSRIATPDTYVLFFALGAVYFTITNRFLPSGIFLGAALASKWTAIFTLFPIVLYLLYRYWQTEQGRKPQFLYLYMAPLSLLAFYMGTTVVFGKFLVDEVSGGVFQLRLPEGLFHTALASWMTLWTLAPLAIYLVYRLRQRETGGQVEGFFREAGLAIPLFFIVVPLYVYILTYLPMLLNGHSMGDVFKLQWQMYSFHTTLDASHPYQSPWDTWPILMRPVYFFLGDENEKIYNLGNPIIFWFGLPALAFALWDGVGRLRARLNPETGDVTFSGIRPMLPALFVVLGFLGLWLPWAVQPRIMFIYHYLPALSFVILALAYVVHRAWQDPGGRVVAAAFLAIVAMTFIYFYPHLAAVPVSAGWEESFYWFPNRYADFTSWR